MRTADVSKLFAYAVSFITVSAGVIVVLGFFVSESLPARFRMTFGVVLVLLGVYRFVMTRVRSARSARTDK